MLFLIIKKDKEGLEEFNMNLLKRVVVGILFIPLILWICYNGGVVLLSFLGLLSFLCSLELNLHFPEISRFVKIINSVFATFLYLAIAFSTANISIVLNIIFIVIIFNSAVAIFNGNIEGAIKKIATSLFIAIYTSLGFGILFLISEINKNYVIILIILIWISDTFAYLFGKFFGKHKNIFIVSPNKSFEGFLGGLICPFLTVVILKYFFHEIFSISNLIIFTISTGVFGQYGDLFESLIKRDLKIKDSSNIIPGHGGVLDRFDSLLIASPIFYFLFLLFK
jgi:phosphatidate cytidylyltransferase